MKQVVTCDFGDLLRHGGEAFGYQWNWLHDIIANDLDAPEDRYRDVYKGEGPCYDWAKETCEVVDSYMEKHGVKEMRVQGL